MTRSHNPKSAGENKISHINLLRCVIISAVNCRVFIPATYLNLYISNINL